MRWTPLLALALVACSGSDKDDPSTTDSGSTEAESATWLMTADWGWVAFNHRLSHLTVRADPPSAAVIGGTSTTGVFPDLGPTCDPDSCKEFPVADTSSMVMVAGSVTTSDAAFRTGSVDIVASSSGDTAVLSVAEPDREGDVVAVLRGLSLDTDHPLDGPEACYDPALGWHPTAIGVELLNPRREGGELKVDVKATFGAGVTEDPDRLCVDEVQAMSQVPFTIDVLFIVADDAVAHDVHQEAYFPFSGDQFAPGPQEVPAPVALPGDGSGLMGWSSLVYRFNTDSPVGRGAYIRTLHFGIDGADAHGTATNFSPITQLHDFGFTFDGVVQEIPLAGVETATYTAVLPAEIDAAGVATVFDLTDPPTTD